MTVRRLAVVIGAAACAVVVLGIVDSLRPRCERFSRRAVPSLVAPFDRDLADSLWFRLNAVSTQHPVYGLSVPNPYELAFPPDRYPGGRTQLQDWTNVQSGLRTVIPPLNAALVTPPPWQESTDSYLSELASLNPSASLLGRESGLPRFLLIQLGGGVEGLEYQALLSEGVESAMIWRGPFESRQELGEPWSESLSSQEIGRFFTLVEAAGLPADSSVEWQCDTQDGAVAVFAYYDGDRVGRVSYVNSRRPAADLLELLRDLFLATGSMDIRLTVYEQAD